MTRMCARTIADRYTLLAPVAGGNVSRVYRALDIRSKRTVALKVLRDETGQDQGRRLQLVQEARAGAMIEHPRVVPISDLGSDDGELFLVMPWIAGQTLRERLLQENTLEAAAAFPLIWDVLAGLDAMHCLGWIHADIKAQNIMLDAEGRATVIDLGCVWRRGEPYPGDDTFIVGSPASMPPEQIRGEGLCPATDLYAVGVLLFRMLTGQLPFQAATPEGMLAQQLHVPAPTPRLINPSIPPDLEAIVLQALQKHPQDRFGSAAEMADALRVSTEGARQGAEAEPATIPEIGEQERPHSRLHRLVRAGKRHLPLEQRSPIAAFSLR